MNNSQKHWGNVRSVLQQVASDWLYDPNVMLIDYGWRERGGNLIENEPCIRVHVQQKFAEGLRLEMATRSGETRGPIPESISGIPVDVQRGVYSLHPWRRRSWWSLPAQNDPRKMRGDPMQGGVSVSNARLRGSGTLGGLVIDRTTGEAMILSNWHVLAGQWQAQVGWPICQPGYGDGGREADTVATLSRHAMSVNLDAAVARLTNSRQLINEQLDIGPVPGANWAQLGMTVIKSGRTTQTTRGRVTGVEGTIRLSYSGVTRLIRNVITITPHLEPEVSAAGDSGSFWLDEKTKHAVGLHFAGSDYPERALAMDMPPIFDALNVDIPG